MLTLHRVAQRDRDCCTYQSKISRPNSVRLPLTHCCVGREEEDGYLGRELIAEHIIINSMFSRFACLLACTALSEFAKKDRSVAEARFLTYFQMRAVSNPDVQELVNPCCLYYFVLYHTIQGGLIPHRLSFLDLHFGSSAMWPECSANSARFAAAKAESGRHEQHFTIA